MVTDNKWIQVAGSGTGNWSNAAHWSLGHVPPGNTTERAVFDADSFGANGETVTVDALSSCGGMDWSAITKTGITLAVTGNILYVYGPDIVLKSGMSVTGSGTYGILARGNGPVNLYTNGVSMGCRIGTYSSGTMTFTLGDALTSTMVDASALYIRTGTFATANKTMTFTGGINFPGSAACTIQLGSSAISCATWSVTDANNTLDANTATITVTGATFAGGKKTTYSSVISTSAAPTFSNANTFTTALTFAAGAVVTWTGCQAIAAGGTLTFGAGSKLILSFAVAATIFDASAAGVVVTAPDQITITDANADALAFKGQGGDTYPLILVTGAGAYTVTFTGGDTITWLTADISAESKVLVADTDIALVKHLRDYQSATYNLLLACTAGGQWDIEDSNAHSLLLSAI